MSENYVIFVLDVSLDWIELPWPHCTPDGTPTIKLVTFDAIREISPRSVKGHMQGAT